MVKDMQINKISYRNISILVILAGFIIFLIGIFIGHNVIQVSFCPKEIIFVFSLLFVLAINIFFLIYPRESACREGNPVFGLFIFSSSAYLLFIPGIIVILKDPPLLNRMVNLSFLDFRALGFCLMLAGSFAFRKYRMIAKREK